MRDWFTCAAKAAGLLLLSTHSAHALDEGGAPVRLSAVYTGDAFATVVGGIDPRLRVLDNVDAVADIDLAAIAGLPDMRAHIDILNNFGARPNDGAATLQGVDNIEVPAARLRLFEAWVERGFGAASLRVGLYDLNSEFYTNEAAGLLIAPAFGIGSELSATGPNGPSIFPSTALAVRVDVRASTGSYVRMAVLSATTGIAALGGERAAAFREGAMGIVEAGIGARTRIAAGVWRYTKRQADLRDLDVAGDPVGRVSQGAYALGELGVGSPDARGAMRLFARIGVSDGRTTPYLGGWQAGAIIDHVFPGRPASSLSFGMAQGLLSGRFRANQRDQGIAASAAETQLEVTYSDAIFPWLSLQPDVQYVVRPGGDRGRHGMLTLGLRVTATIGQ